MTTSLSLPSKPSTTDPTPLFEFYRGCYGTELLAVALVEFRIFDRLKAGGLSFAVLKDELGISDRALNVLLTGLRAMGMLTVAPDQSLRLSELAADRAK